MSSKIGSFVLILVLLFCMNAFSSEQEEGILFLTLQVTGDQVTLIESTLTHGTMKNPRAESKTFDINYEAISKSGNVLVSNGIDDPRFEMLEYEDPENPGRLKHVEVTRETANFVIRVNSNKDLSHINFFRYVAQIKSDGSIEKTKVDIGRVDLSQIGGDQ